MGLVSRSHNWPADSFIPNTDKNIIWYDTETHVVKITKHARFDEGMNDLPPDLVPPNVVYLQRTQNGEPLPAKTEETSVDQFTFHLNPFSYTMVKGVQVTDDDPSYGLTLATDESDKLWEKHITAILRSPQFGFKSTTHDRSVYSATFKGTRMLLLRQVDDFAVGRPNEDLAKRLYDPIGKA